jgi:hypothetical protein
VPAAPSLSLAREEETQHFPCRVRPARIGVGAGGTASRPGVAGTVNVPVLGDGTPARIGKDGASIGMPVGHPSAKHLRCRTRRFGGLLENSAAVARMHRGVTIAVETMVGTGDPASATASAPPPRRIAMNAEARSLAAPQARPEWMPTAAYRLEATTLRSVVGDAGSRILSSATKAVSPRRNGQLIRTGGDPPDGVPRTFSSMEQHASCAGIRTAFLAAPPFRDTPFRCRSAVFREMLIARRGAAEKDVADITFILKMSQSELMTRLLSGAE